MRRKSFLQALMAIIPTGIITKFSLGNGSAKKELKSTTTPRPYEGLVCPRCRKIQHQVCTNKECWCYKRIPSGEKPQIYISEGILACPYCGFTESGDWWFDEDISQFKISMGTKSLTEATEINCRLFARK